MTRVRRKKVIITIIFKKHPAFQGEDPILKRLKQHDVPFELNLISQFEAMEDLIDEYSVFKVLTFSFSSANVELQLIYCNQLASYVYNPLLESDPHYNGVFKELSRKFQLKSL